jgi:hypothetical protein
VARARVSQERDDHPFGATVMARPATDLVPLVPLSGSMVGLSPLIGLDDTDACSKPHGRTGTPSPTWRSTSLATIARRHTTQGLAGSSAGPRHTIDSG